ncbi:lysophospholipase [Deinococcus sp. KNUC1210]|uniref:alpha/beta hydrolase n=1 Tax=Deinococcus sp. KNUC1210 TaxID=2917691 RepID=UPI001EF077A5|nr:alpha/beta hydrolase [Deinococcus sp. KNUC1210]ULH15625.1 lysophospholipase [Deinococcus sp. KNUC1210]
MPAFQPWPITPAAPVQTFLWPAQQQKAAVLLAHGFGEYSARYHRLIGAMNEAGYSVYTYDHRGHGESTGRRAVADLRDLVQDHIAARSALRSLDVPLFAFGHSMGGLITAASYLQDPRGVKGVVLSSPALLVGVGEPRWRKQAGRVLARLVPHLPLAALPTEGLSRLPEEVEAYRNDPLMYHGNVPVLTAISMLRLSETLWGVAGGWKLPTLTVHGDQDRLADVNGSRRFMEAIASRDKTYHEVAGGFHELFNDTGRDDLTRELLDWMDARA